MTVKNLSNETLSSIRSWMWRDGMRNWMSGVPGGDALAQAALYHFNLENSSDEIIETVHEMADDVYMHIEIEKGVEAGYLLASLRNG